ISTYRFKAIRKGLEDYELFLQARNRGHESTVREHLQNAVGRDWYQYPQRQPYPEELEEAKIAILTTVYPYAPTCGDSLCENEHTPAPKTDQTTTTCYTPTKPGDLTCDNTVNIHDLTLIGSTYNWTPTHPQWNTKGTHADACTPNQHIDLNDLQCVTNHFGTQY
ncbi:MAG: hypothetical protein HC945_00795, partial [Nitrosarchaeum sp.]|nr:hypothetical protein [Nitrosarchaeum sp.]